MCLGSSSKSSAVSTPQSLNLGSPSLGGSDYVLQMGNAPNLTSATFYMTQPSQTGLSSLTSGSGMAYMFLLGLAFVGYKLLT